MQDAVAWVKNNKKPEESVFLDERRLIFYYGGEFKAPMYEPWKEFEKISNNGHLEDYDFLVINYNSKHLFQQPESLSKFTEVATFNSTKPSKKIIIFKKK